MSFGPAGQMLPSPGQQSQNGNALMTHLRESLGGFGGFRPDKISAFQGGAASRNAAHGNASSHGPQVLHKFESFNPRTETLAETDEVDRDEKRDEDRDEVDRAIEKASHHQKNNKRHSERKHEVDDDDSAE